MLKPLSHHRSIFRTVKAVGVAALCAVVFAGCAVKQPEQQAAASTPGVKTVKVAPIGKVQIAEPAEQVADVLSSAQVDVVAKTGAEVQQLVKQRGDAVAKGDVIIKLDATDAKLQRDKAALAVQSAEQALSSGKLDLQNSLTKMTQALENATKAYNKARNDYDLGTIDQTQLDQAEDAYTNAKNDLEALQAKSTSALEIQLKSAQLSLEQADRALAECDIAAPIGGIITDLPVQSGMTVAAGTRVAQIQQLDPIKIKALLTPDSAKLVQGKSELSFRMAGDSHAYTGKISYLSEVMDTQTNSYELNLSVPNKDLKLKPGTKVQVQLTSEAEEQVVAVPSLSIVREGTDAYVFVLVGDHVEKRKVELGRLNDINQEIVAGVKEGEQLVVSGQNQLSDQDQVTVEK